MKLIYIFALLGAFVTADAFKDCTAAVRDMVDDLYDVVEDVEASGFDVKDDTMKTTLSGMTSVAKTCFSMDVDLTAYDGCVDAMWPLVAEVGKVVSDVKSGQYNNLIADFLQIANTAQQGMGTCTQSKKQTVMEYLF